MKVTGTMRRNETKELVSEADSYEQARADLESQVPEGWELIQILVDR